MSIPAKIYGNTSMNTVKLSLQYFERVVSHFNKK